MKTLQGLMLVCLGMFVSVSHAASDCDPTVTYDVSVPGSWNVGWQYPGFGMAWFVDEDTCVPVQTPSMVSGGAHWAMMVSGVGPNDYPYYLSLTQGGTTQRPDKICVYHITLPKAPYSKPVIEVETEQGIDCGQYSSELGYVNIKLSEQ